MYGYRGLGSLRAEIMIIFEVMTDIVTYTYAHTHQFHLYVIDSAHLVGWAERKDVRGLWRLKKEYALKKETNNTRRFFS